MSIRKRSSKKAKNGYVYEVYFNYTNVYGVPCRYSKSGFGSKKEAQNHETEKKQELLEHGTIKREVKLTLNEIFDEAIKNEFPNIYQENTIVLYKTYYNKHVRNNIGNCAIVTLNYSALRAFFNEKATCGQSLIEGIKKVLNATINYALKCEYIQFNPLTLIKPKGREPEPKEKIYTDSEFNTVVNELKEWKNTELRTPFIIALYIGKYTALRISEAFALDWSDIDFDSNTISVAKKLVYHSDELHVSSKMKTNSSAAIIPLVAPLKQILAEWKTANKFDHVICEENGAYINPFKLQERLRIISKKNGFKFTYHMLRHTYATQLYNEEVDIKTIQSLLRHSNVNTTLGIYTHKNIDELSNTVDNIFNSKSVEKVSKIKNYIN